MAPDGAAGGHLVDRLQVPHLLCVAQEPRRQGAGVALREGPQIRHGPLRDALVRLGAQRRLQPHRRHAGLQLAGLDGHLRRHQRGRGAAGLHAGAAIVRAAPHAAALPARRHARGRGPLLRPASLRQHAAGLGAGGQARAKQGGRGGQDRRLRDSGYVDGPDQHRAERVLHRGARLGPPQPGVRAAALRRQLCGRAGGVHQLGTRRQDRLLEPH
mmetsp:Transcript_33155/g.78782  ORF Transcript_33155/g.78782 Transcript_33155/m.78782 type:complete len:214 (+) Transcript_33155:508-1149(+)